MKKLRYLLIIPTLVTAPALAEVRSAEDNGFVIFHTAEISASPDDIWQRLTAPKDWWQKEHSWSGSSEGFYVEARAGGCFCETLLEKQADGAPKNVGSVEHMRVIFAHPGKVLRMQGALGPLQSEAVTGTFTVAMAPQPGGKSSKISFSYVVGGYMRYKVAAIAPAVDKVLAAQFASLIAPFKIAETGPEIPAGWSLDVDGVTQPKAASSAEDVADEAADAPPDAPPADADKPQTAAAKPKIPVTNPSAAAKKER